MALAMDQGIKNEDLDGPALPDGDAYEMGRRLPAVHTGLGPNFRALRRHAPTLLSPGSSVENDTLRAKPLDQAVGVGEPGRLRSLGDPLGKTQQAA